MEPEVRYCMASDGVRIAYTVASSGSPLVFLSDPCGSHVQLEWSHPTLGPEYTELTHYNNLIRIDLRGSGLSDRTLPTSVNDWVLDIEAVVTRLNLDQFALASVVSATPSAITFAARHGERVRRLVVIDGYAAGGGPERTTQGQALQTLASIDYDLATELIGVMAFGGDRDEVRHNGAFTRECVGLDYLKHLPVISSWDASDECAAVRAPTLVLYHRELGFIDEDTVRDLAARLPDAKLRILDGKMADDPLGMALQVAEFVNDREIARPPDAIVSSAASGMTAILFADIVDSTALTETLGDTAFRDRARDLDATLRGVIRDHSGTPIEGKLLGDGVLATFASARQAIEAALACGVSGASAGLPLHLGLHAGDVIREDNNVFGGVVNIAARISGLSAPGEVLVSHTVRDLARTSAGVGFEDRGEHSLKGVGEPVRVWAVRNE